MAEWIKTKERLPEPFYPVLLYIPDEEPFMTVSEGYIDKNGRFLSHRCYGVFEKEEVPFWAEMPEPPTVETTCAGCMWENRKRPQKCSCCRRNKYMKDSYEVR